MGSKELLETLRCAVRGFRKQEPRILLPLVCFCAEFRPPDLGGGEINASTCGEPLKRRVDRVEGGGFVLSARHYALSTGH